MTSPTQIPGVRSTRWLWLGISLLIAGVVVHEWTLKYLLKPEEPFRLNARLHWWFLSLNFLAIGVCLIAFRRRIRPLAVGLIAFVYLLLGSLLVLADLWRGYIAATSSDPRSVSGEYQMVDRELGWTLKPDAQARITRPGKYDVVYSTDSEGFRTTTTANDAVQRLFVLGDSFAFGWGVGDSDTFCSQLGAALATNFAVVNMGVEGHGITQIYARFLQRKSRIRRGDIVLFTFIADDINRNWRDFVFVSRMLFGKKPIKKFPVYEDGEIRLQDADSWVQRGKAVVVHAPWLGSLFAPLLVPPRHEALDDAAEMIARVRQETESRGATFLLVQLPTGGELQGKPALDCARLGAIDIRERFGKDATARQKYFLAEDDGHYSAEGHRLVAGILRDELMKRGCLQKEAVEIGLAN